MPVHPESQLSNSEDNANSDMGEIDLAIVDFKKAPELCSSDTQLCQYAQEMLAQLDGN